MSFGPIPITAVWQYVDRYALPEWSVEAIMRLDGEYLELVNHG